MIWLVYLLQVFVVLATIGIIMIQKGSDGIFSSNKVFGIRGRSNTIIRITYVLGAIFLINNMILGILYQKKHKAELIGVAKTEQPAKTDAKVNS